MSGRFGETTQRPEHLIKQKNKIKLQAPFPIITGIFWETKMQNLTVLYTTNDDDTPSSKCFYGYSYKIYTPGMVMREVWWGVASMFINFSSPFSFVSLWTSFICEKIRPDPIPRSQDQNHRWVFRVVNPETRKGKLDRKKVKGGK